MSDTMEEFSPGSLPEMWREATEYLVENDYHEIVEAIRKLVRSAVIAGHSAAIKDVNPIFDTNWRHEGNYLLMEVIPALGESG